VWGRPSPRSSPHSGNTGTNTPSGTRLNRAPPDRRPASGSVGATTRGYPEGGRAGPPLRERSNRGAYEPSVRSAPSLPAGLCGLGHALQRLPRQFLVAGLYGEVAEGDDPDQPLVVVQHRHTADLAHFHHLRRRLHVLVFEAIDDLRGHHLARLGGVGV